MLLARNQFFLGLENDDCGSGFRIGRPRISSRLAVYLVRARQRCRGQRSARNGRLRPVQYELDRGAGQSDSSSRARCGLAEIATTFGVKPKELPIDRLKTPEPQLHLAGASQ